MSVQASDIEVYGAGIIGSTITRMARDRGLTVTLIDPQPEHAASRASIAIIRLAWHQPGHDRRRANYGLGWLAARGWRYAAGATITNYRTPGRAHPDRDYHLIHPTRPLLEPDRAERDPDAPPPALTVTATGVCAIPDTENRSQWGWTATADGDLGDDLRIHHYAPYKAIAAAQVGTQIRVGSSTHRDLARAETMIEEMLHRAIDVGLVPPDIDGWHFEAGCRPIDGSGGRPRWDGPGHVTVTGTGKVGYALAPAIATEVLDRAFTASSEPSPETATASPRA